MGKIYEVKRGKRYVYYYRHSHRVKLNGTSQGKVRGSGPSKVVTQNIYLGTAEKTILRLKGLSPNSR